MQPSKWTVIIVLSREQILEFHWHADLYQRFTSICLGIEHSLKNFLVCKVLVLRRKIFLCPRALSIGLWFCFGKNMWNLEVRYLIQATATRRKEKGNSNCTQGWVCFRKLNSINSENVSMPVVNEMSSWEFFFLFLSHRISCN